MDRRTHPRHSLALEVIVHYPPVGLIDARTRDLNAGGMSIDLNQITLATHTPVRVTFPLPGDPWDTACEAKALIVHSTADGARLAFQDPGNPCLELLRERLCTEPE